MERYFDKSPDALVAEYCRQMQERSGTEAPVVIMAHPTMYTSTIFYDLHNQTGRGIFRPKAEWQPPPQVPREEYRRRLEALDTLAAAVAADGDADRVSHSQFIARRRETPRWLTAPELRQAAEGVMGDFNFQRLGAGWLSAADAFGALSAGLARRGSGRSLPEVVPVRRLLGPAEEAPALSEPFHASAGEVVSACAQAEAEAEAAHRLPVSVSLSGRSVPPGSFLHAMAAVVLGADKVEVDSAPLYPRCCWDIYDTIRVSSSELRDDFGEGTIVTHSHLQSWSVRPAVRP